MAAASASHQSRIRKAQCQQGRTKCKDHNEKTSLQNSEDVKAIPWLLGAKGIATRSKDATRGSWPYYK